MQFEVDSFQGHRLDASQLIYAPNTQYYFSNVPAPAPAIHFSSKAELLIVNA